MSTPSGYRPIGSNAGFIFAAQTIGSMLRAIYAAILARKLGPEFFGLMNYGLGWYATFLAVANLQLESYMSRQIALNRANAAEVLSKAMTLRIGSTILALIVAIVLATSPGNGRLLSTVLLIYAVAMAGRSAAMWCSSAFISQERAWQVFRVEVTFRFAEVLGGISALLMGYGLIAVAAIHALAWWAQAIVQFQMVRNHLPAVHLRANASELVALFRTVLPVAAASIGAAWLMQGPFVLFKAKALAAGDLGVVALVLQIYILVAGMPVALGRAALPALSRTVARTDSKDAIFLGLVLRAAIGGTTALVIAAATAGTWAVPLVFGEAYRSAGVYLPYGMMLVLPFGVGTIANQILIAHDRTWQAMMSAALGAAAMTILVITLMPVGGAAAVYFLCIFTGTSVWSIATLALLSPWVAVKWRQCLVMPALASALSLGVYYLLINAIGSWGSLVVSLLVLIAGHWILNIVERCELVQVSRHLFTRVARRPTAQ